MTPRVSVVIPTYNGAASTRQAIQSVLDQTYQHFEIVVVDDASTEESPRDVMPSADTRVRYVQHADNKGAVAARRTGVHASTGDIVAFLDQDDLFHAHKLEAHVHYLQTHPGTGGTYNSRFHMQGPDNRLIGLHRPPEALLLQDWVLGFPLSPSDIVLKREWALRDDIWDDSYATRAEHVIFNGGEIVFGGRLTLAGCTLGRVDRVLNFRRLHPHRVLRHLAERCQAELACQEIIFDDPRCPPSVRSLRRVASANITLMWAHAAFIQEEFDLGRRLLEQTIALHPEALGTSDSSGFFDTWLLWIAVGTIDDVRGHDGILASVFDNLPERLQGLSRRREWAMARSHLLKGLHTAVWGPREHADMSLATAFDTGASLDEGALNMLSDELLNYESEFGVDAGQRIVDHLSHLLSARGRGAEARTLLGHCAVNRAFQHFHSGQFESVPGNVARAVRNAPRHVLNRGVLSILVRSLSSRRARQ